MIVGLVCARKGSVGLPDKNIRELKGVKLIDRAIIKAREVCDEVVICTDYIPGVDFWQGRPGVGAHWINRPPHLAGPKVSKWDVWRHAAETFGHRDGDVFVDVDVTRPLCTADTMRKVIAAAEDRGAALAVAESNKHPAFDLLKIRNGLTTLYDPESVAVARQELQPVYQHAGCYAFARAELFRRSGIFDGPISPVIVSRIQSFDIDDELDWRVVEALCD